MPRQYEDPQGFERKKTTTTNTRKAIFPDFTIPEGRDIMTLTTIELTSTHHTASTTNEPSPLSQELATGNLTLKQLLLTIGKN